METQKAKRVLRIIRSIPHQHFVLHGSLIRSNTLLPNKPKLKFKKHRKLNKKGVYATAVINIAVMYASMENRMKWKFIRKGGEIHVLHEKKDGEEKPILNLYDGYIHVCRREIFGKAGALILFSKRPAKVVRTFKISHEIFLYLWNKKAVKIVPEF